MARPIRDRPDVEFFAEVGRIEQLHRNRLERALPGGLTAAQLALMTRLAHAGPQQPAQLAAALRLTKGAITNTAQRLVAAGLAAETADREDRRRKTLDLTGRGRALHAEAAAALRPLAEALRADFPMAHFEAALPFLRALSAWLDAAPDLNLRALEDEG